MSSTPCAAAAVIDAVLQAREEVLGDLLSSLQHGSTLTPPDVAGAGEHSSPDCPPNAGFASFLSGCNNPGRAPSAAAHPHATLSSRGDVDEVSLDDVMPPTATGGVVCALFGVAAAARPSVLFDNFVDDNDQDTVLSALPEPVAAAPRIVDLPVPSLPGGVVAQDDEAASDRSSSASSSSLLDLPGTATAGDDGASGIDHRMGVSIDAGDLPNVDDVALRSRVPTESISDAAPFVSEGTTKQPVCALHLGSGGEDVVTRFVVDDSFDFDAPCLSRKPTNPFEVV